jgi:hypothetical protein
MRLTAFCLGLCLTSGCMAVSSEQAANAGVQRVQSGAAEFLVEYRVFEETAMEVFNTDGTSGMSFAPAGSAVFVSRADGTQFTKDRADEQVARVAARTYCEQLGLGLGDVQAITTKFGPQSATDNAEWRIYNVCAKPN